MVSRLSRRQESVVRSQLLEGDRVNTITVNRSLPTFDSYVYML
jgi:hypothetical protein